MGILIRETFVDQSQHAQIGETDVHETRFDRRGSLFLSLQKEYGHCVSKVYVDRPNGKAKAIGWVFVKRLQYEDTDRYGRPAEYYMQEVWIEIHKRMPKKTVKYYYWE